MQKNIIVYVGELVGRSVSVEWFLIGLGLSVLAGLLMTRARHTPIYALVASLVHVVVLAALPTLQAGKVPALDAVIAAVQSNAKGPDLAVLVVEYCLYMFMIWIVFLSKTDIFRTWPPEGASSGH